MLKCENGACEYSPKLRREYKMSKDEIRYAQLWAEIELPKQLNRGDKT